MGDKISAARNDSLHQDRTVLGPEEGELIRRYLLCELTEQEQQQVEERLMTDDEYYKQVLLAEDDLTDEYVSEELSGREQERFEYSFLSTPEGRQEVSFTKALRKYASNAAVAAELQSPGRSAERVSWWDSLAGLLRPEGSVVRWSLAAAAVLLLVGSASLVIKVSRLETELDQLQAKQSDVRRSEQESQQQLIEERARKDQLTEKLQRQQEQHTSLEQELARLRTEQRDAERASNPGKSQLPDILASLEAGIVRARGRTNRLNIPPVRLKLVLSEDRYMSYRATLEPVGGKEIWSQAKLKAKRVGSSNSIILSLPANILSRGDYQIKLSGLRAGGEFEEVGAYHLRVVE